MAGFDQFGGYGGDEIRCSFCGKTRDQVRKLIQSPSGVFICDECVTTCYDIISDGCVIYHDVAEESVDQLCEEMKRKPYLYSNIEVKEI